MSVLDLEERRELEASERAEFADMGLGDLETERARREDELEDFRALCLPEQVRVVGRRLDALRAEIERRGPLVTMALPDSVARGLRRVRTERGLQQHEIAAMLGVHTSTISRIGSGDRKVR
jgi:ribosome-binding protein aMBF1 (putative translation factor)